MIYWVLRKLGLIAQLEMLPDAFFDADADADAEIIEDYELVPAPIIQGPRTTQLAAVMARFSSQLGDVPLAELKPFVRTPIRNDSNKDFFEKLTKIVGNPPVNQTPPTASDVLLTEPKKKKNFYAIKPTDTLTNQRDALLSQIKSLQKVNEVEVDAVAIESSPAAIKLSSVYISQRLAITQVLCQMKANHFSLPVSADIIRDNEIIEGLSAPMAPPLVTGSLSEIPLSRAPAYR